MVTLVSGKGKNDYSAGSRYFFSYFGGNKTGKRKFSFPNVYGVIIVVTALIATRGAMTYLYLEL